MRRIDFKNGWLSPIHFHNGHVHADLNYSNGGKIHIPYYETTLDMYGNGATRSIDDQLRRINRYGLGSLYPGKKY